MSYNLFFSPKRINNMEVRNRIVLPPMGMGASEDAFVNQHILDYYEARARGGCGLLIVEATSIHKETSPGVAQMGIYDDSQIPGFTDLANVIKKHGAKSCVQIWHGGRQSPEFGWNKVWGASEIPSPVAGTKPHAMTKEEILLIEDKYAEAALRVKKAGFDCVEIHGASGYLIDQFVTPYVNSRTDEYGGSLENRARFGIEVIKKVRAAVGGGYPILYRMDVDQILDGGFSLEEAVETAKLFEAAGIDAMDITRGHWDTMDEGSLMFFYPYDMMYQYARAVKDALSIPLILAGRNNSPERVEYILKNNIADFAAVGRPQIADPDFVNKVKEGREDEIIRCVACNKGCIEGSFAGIPATCIFNPTSGRESEKQVTPAQKKKKVVVIGGGPSGLEAARVAKERGHDVKLFEKTTFLGGQVRLAGYPPHKEEFIDAVNIMAHRCYKAGVDIHINTVVDLDRLNKENPDVVIVATGSDPLIPKIDGTDGDNVFEARAVIEGRQRIAAEEVAVIGGGMVGLETAEILANQGKKITVIEMLDAIGKDMGLVRNYMMRVIDRFGMKVLVQSKCVKISEDGVTVEGSDGKTGFVPAKAVVIAVGGKSNTEMVKLAEQFPEHYVVGDANTVGQILNATVQAFDVARSI